MSLFLSLLPTQMRLGQVPSFLGPETLCPNHPAESVSWFAETLNNLVRTAKASTTLSIKVVIHITGGGPNEKSEDVGIEGSSVFYSRPDVQGHLDSILRVVHKTTVDRGDERGGGLGVGCCGPAGLVKQVRSLRLACFNMRQSHAWTRSGLSRGGM